MWRIDSVLPVNGSAAPGEREAGSGGSGLGVGAPLLHRRLGRRPVEGQDRAPELLVEGRGERLRGVGRDAGGRQQSGQLVLRGGDRGGDPLLTGSRRLPQPGEVVPHELRVQQAGDVADPRARSARVACRRGAGRRRHPSHDRRDRRARRSPPAPRPASRRTPPWSPRTRQAPGRRTREGGASATSVRERCSSSGSHTAGVSGLPWTKTAGIAGCYVDDAPRPDVRGQEAVRTIGRPVVTTTVCSNCAVRWPGVSSVQPSAACWA